MYGHGVSGICCRPLGSSPLPGREPVLRLALGGVPWGPLAARQPPPVLILLSFSAYERDLLSPALFAFVSASLRKGEVGGEPEVVEKIHREII